MATTTVNSQTTYATTKNFVIGDAELDQAIAEARACMEEAWTGQSRTTVDDGYTYEQAQAAIDQAQQAELYYRQLCAIREKRLIARRVDRELDDLLLMRDEMDVIAVIEDAPIDASPLGGW